MSTKPQGYFGTWGVGRRCDVMFLNRRCEIGWRVRDRSLNTYYNKGGANIFVRRGITADKLKKEICNIKYEFTEKGQLKLESKKNWRLRHGRSPDYYDALCCAFAKDCIGV